MKFLRRFNESESYSYFDTEQWKKFLPKELKLVTSDGNWTLTLPDENNNMRHATNVTHLMNCIQIIYSQNTPSREDGDVTRDGEPDQLGFDITIVKNNDGHSANPDTLKLTVDITYGDSMAVEFIIEKPNKISVLHYTGIGSKYDSDTSFGFEDESIKSLVNFFNSWGFKLTPDDLSFIDKYPDTYIHQKNNESIKINPSFGDECILIINNNKPQENTYLSNVIKYLDYRAISWKIASTPHEIEKMNREFNIIGAISTGSDYRLNYDGQLDNTKKAIQTLDCPILAICYGLQSMAKVYGVNIVEIGEYLHGNYTLTNYKNHKLFDGLNLKNTEFSFSANDCLESCPSGFEVIGQYKDLIAAIADDQKKQYGLLFHPENIEYTYKILDNFISMCDGGRIEDVERLKGEMQITNVVEKYSDFLKRIKR